MIQTRKDPAPEGGDRALAERVRAGDADAAATLRARHDGVAQGYAVLLRERGATSDPTGVLVADGFAAAFADLRASGAPSGPFRPFLLAKVRDRSAGAGALPGLTASDSSRLESTSTVRAFRALPSVWQDALWYADVERLPLHRAAEPLGADPDAATALLRDARTGLHGAWLTVVRERAAVPPACAAVLAQLADRPSDAAPSSDLSAHAATCLRCLTLLGEVDDLSSKLGLLLVPLTLGINEPEYLRVVTATGEPPTE